MDHDTQKIEKSCFGQRILRAAQEGVALTKDRKSVPSTSTVNLSPKEVIAEVNITYDTLENNIEQEVAYRCDLYQFILIESNLKDLQPYSRI